MPRDAFVLKIQRELCHPKYTRKVSGLSRNSPQAPFVQTVDNAIHRINHYPLDIAIGFAITYPVDSDLSGG